MNDPKKETMPETKKETCNLGCRLTKRLPGWILVDGEFISPHDLESAVAQQRHSNEQLGEILVRMGVLASIDLKAVLSIQRHLSSLEDAVKTTAGTRQLLSELLIQAKQITPEQLDLALKEQKQTGERLGEVLVRRGLLTERELNTVLEFQRYQSGELPMQERLRLGEILIATNQITREQLEAVLTRQKLSKKKIGELLIEAGYAEPHQIGHGLNLQKKLVTAELAAALSLATLAMPEEARTSDPAVSGRSIVVVTASVKAHTTLKVLCQNPELVITNADISRGYVEVQTASRIEVKNNNPAGYLLVFDGINGHLRPFNEVYVQGLEREVQIGSGGGWIPQPYTRGAVIMELSYRFILSKDAQPGTYAWPLTVSVRPI